MGTGIDAYGICDRRHPFNTIQSFIFFLSKKPKGKLLFVCFFSLAAVLHFLFMYEGFEFLYPPSNESFRPPKKIKALEFLEDKNLSVFAEIFLPACTIDYSHDKWRSSLEGNNIDYADNSDNVKKKRKTDIFTLRQYHVKASFNKNEHNKKKITYPFTFFYPFVTSHSAQATSKTINNEHESSEKESSRNNERQNKNTAKTEEERYSNLVERQSVRNVIKQIEKEYERVASLKGVTCLPLASPVLVQRMQKYFNEMYSKNVNASKKNYYDEYTVTNKNEESEQTMDYIKLEGNEEEDRHMLHEKLLFNAASNSADSYADDTYDSGYRNNNEVNNGSSHVTKEQNEKQNKKVNSSKPNISLFHPHEIIDDFGSLFDKSMFLCSFFLAEKRKNVEGCSSDDENEDNKNTTRCPNGTREKEDLKAKVIVTKAIRVEEEEEELGENKNGEKVLSQQKEKEEKEKQKSKNGKEEMSVLYSRALQNERDEQPEKKREIISSVSSASPSSASSSSASFSSLSSSSSRRVFHMVWGGCQAFPPEMLMAIDSVLKNVEGVLLKIHVILSDRSFRDFCKMQHLFQLSLFFSSSSSSFFSSSSSFAKFGKNNEIEYVEYLDLDVLLLDTPAEGLDVSVKSFNEAHRYERKKQVLLSDLIRLLVLYKLGGTYIDTDVLLLHDFSFVSNVLSCENQDGYEDINECVVCNAILSFEKGHLFLHRAIERAADFFQRNTFRRAVNMQWGSIGPTLFSDLLKEWIKEQDFHYYETINDAEVAFSQDIESINLFSYRSFFPLHYSSSKYTYAGADQYWDDHAYSEEDEVYLLGGNVTAIHFFKVGLLTGHHRIDDLIKNRYSLMAKVHTLNCLYYCAPSTLYAFASIFMEE